MKELPFKLDRKKRSPLIEQIINGVTAAVRSGYFKSGDKLPTMLEMHEQLEVSMMVIRHAIKRLGDKGLVEVKKNTGIKITENNGENMAGNILFISPGGNVSYFFAARNHALIKRLREARIHVTALNIFESREKDRFSIVQHYLDIHPVNLVLIEGNPWDVDKHIHRQNIPVLQVFNDTNSHSDIAVDSLILDFSNAYSKIAKHCSSCGIQTVLPVVSGLSSEREELRKAFHGAGIKFERVPVTGTCREDSVTSDEVPSERAGYDMMVALIKSGNLPDLLLSSDDYRSRGIVTACLENGIRIPADIQLVTMVNIGHTPVMSKPFSRIEMDPRLLGEKMAELVLRNIKKHNHNYRPIIFAPKFVVGKTTKRLR